MTEGLPERLDLLAAAEAGRELHGRIALDGLERVAPLLASPVGELEVALRLERDASGTFCLSGRIGGDVVLQCQRCLEDMVLELAIEFRLGLVRSQAEANRLARRYEPLIVTDEPASIADIVSDEILLALPFAPVHADTEPCSGLLEDYRAEPDGQRENPFAVLAELKQRH